MTSRHNAPAAASPEPPAGPDDSQPATTSRASSAGADHRDENYYNGIETFGMTSIYLGLSSLLGSEKSSDMTIRCGDRAFKAHRAIVCSQSAFFDKALTGGFAEAATSIVNLPEDDPDVMERFLEFLYTGTYDVDTYPWWSTPMPVSMLSPDGIGEELNMLPGVNVAGTPDEEDEAVAESAVPPTTGGTRTRANAAADGPGGTAQSGSSEHTDDEPPTPEEPEEEYNEFHEPESDEDENAPLTRRRLQLRSELGDEEGRDKWLRGLLDLEDLYLPLRLYVMADKYDVPALKLLARDRFYRSAELVWKSAECFPDVVDELYNTTPPADLAMREIVCRLVGSGIKEGAQRERMEGVMRKHGDFAVGVMNYMIQSASHIWT